MSHSIGQQLKNARIDRNLSIEDVFKSTHIRIKYLEALEADDFSVMPSLVQGRGFLRLYAQFLGLHVETILAEIQSQGTDENIFVKVDTKYLVDEPDPLISEEPEEPVALEEKEEKPVLWYQLLDRFGISFARPERVSVHKPETVPISKSSQKSTIEAETAQVLEPDRIKRPHPKFGSKPRDLEIPDVVYQYAKAEPPLPTDESHVLFAQIGKTLRERREMLSLTYEEIEVHIHLRPHYLAALEAGNFEALPSPVQTRGMLSNYADFLDLDSEALLLRFAEGLQAQRIERHIEVAEAEAGKRKRRRFSLGGFMAPDLVFGGGVILLMVAFAVWGLGRIADSRAEETLMEATAPSIAEVLMSTSTLEVVLSATPTLVVVNTPGGELGTVVPLDENLEEDTLAGVQILVTVLERSWLRVRVDGEVVFEGRAQPNASFVYEGNESIEVLTANGAGIRIGYNQRDLGLMGGFGEVVQSLYGPRGLLTPTVTPTSNATPTRTPTVTPSPTQTPTLEVDVVP